MDELLGLIDSLEANILDAKRIPMTDKLILEERIILPLIDKIRLSAKSGTNLARQSIEKSLEGEAPIEVSRSDQDAKDLLAETIKEANEIRVGSQEYAEYVLANLHLMVTKMQKNLMKLEKNLEGGRDVLEKKKEKEIT